MFVHKPLLYVAAVLMVGATASGCASTTPAAGPAHGSAIPGTHKTEPAPSSATLPVTDDPSPVKEFPQWAPPPALPTTTNTTISGMVTTPDGQPVQGVIIQIKNMLGESVIVRTDENGRYSEDVGEGVFRVYALSDDPTAANLHPANGDTLWPSISLPEDAADHVDFVWIP